MRIIVRNEQANGEDRSYVELETKISGKLSVWIEDAHETDSPEHFLDRSRHVPFRIFLLCRSQTNHFTS
jgi:hypothetical protein